MYKLLLCLRYLRTRYIALASIISVMLGVATMIVVNSVMAGFGTEMRDRIHGLLADVIIETHSLDGMPDPEALMERVRRAAGDDIAGMTATVEIYGMLSFRSGSEYVTRPVTVIGIDPEEKSKVGPLVDYLDSYNAHVEEGRITRKALRNRNEPPSWELTSEAKQKRVEWAELQRSMQRWASHTTSMEDRQFAVQTAVAEESDSPFTDIPGDDDPIFQTSTSEVEQTSPTVASPPQFLPQEETARAPSADPLEGRIYVGKGLISFPYEDQATGKVKTHMMVRPGDDVKLSTIGSGRPPEPVHFDATVVDVFKSGMSEYDSNLIFCDLAYLQKVRGMIDPQTGKRHVTSIQIKLKDFQNSDSVVERLKAAFPPETFAVRTWEQKQGPLLAAVDVESTILNVLLFLIIAVAGFGILAIFFMIVVEKTRDIGILKALGASRRGVMSIFLSYGLGLGIVGSGVGTVIGLLFVRYINEIEKFVTMISGRKVFDERIYYFPEIPTNVSPMMVVWVAAGAIAIAVLASILPARRAAGLHPVEALRYE